MHVWLIICICVRICVGKCECVWIPRKVRVCREFTKSHTYDKYTHIFKRLGACLVHCCCCYCQLKKNSPVKFANYHIFVNTKQRQSHLMLQYRQLRIYVHTLCTYNIIYMYVCLCVSVQNFMKIASTNNAQILRLLAASKKVYNGGSFVLSEVFTKLWKAWVNLISN